MISFDLPAPPSTNQLYRNVAKVGRVKTKRYLAWCNTAGIEAKKAKLGWHADTRQEWTRIMDSNEYMLCIRIPHKLRGDIDNRIKGILDLFVSLGLTPDDSRCQTILITKSYTIIGPRVVVSIYPTVKAEAA